MVVKSIVRRLAALLCLACLLSGCASLDEITLYVGPEELVSQESETDTGQTTIIDTKASTKRTTTTTTTTTTKTTTTTTTTTTKTTTTTTTTTAQTRPSTTQQTLPSQPSTANGKTLIQVNTIHQFPEYPTGCESVAAVMALRYAGENTSVANFIDNHLPCSQAFYWEDGKAYGPNPYEVFLGNPRTQNSYGCMAPVIKKALISFLGTSQRVIDATGKEFSALCQTYVANGSPVIVWVSISMVEIKDGPSWIMPNGETYTWPQNEHCMLLVGFDASKYYFNDPYTGRVVSYSRTVVESRYNRLGKQALVVTL